MKFKQLETLERITEHKTTMEVEYNGKNVKEVCYYDNDAQEYNYGIFINDIEIIKFEEPIGEQLQLILKALI